MSVNPGKNSWMAGLCLLSLSLPGLGADGAARPQESAEVGQVVKLQIQDQTGAVEDDACSDKRLEMPRAEGSLSLVAHADCGLIRILWRQVQ